MKKKKLLVQKTVLMAVCLTCALSMSACGFNKKNNQNNQNNDPLTGEQMSETGESNTSQGMNTTGGNYAEFDTMIGDQNTNPNDIINYINTNIVSAGVSDVEYFFRGLLGFGNDIRDIDFTGLEQSRQYMPEDMIAFMDLMKLEADTPSMVMSNEENRRVINMTLSEMLERALLFEQHLEKYPDNVTTDAAERLYMEIATQAITGGYDKTAGISHYYKGATEDVIDQESLQYYQQFAEANPDSNLGRIVAEYVTILRTNQFQINDAVEEFYMGLQERLAVKTWANTNNNGQTGTNGTNGNNTTGNGTNGTNTNGTNGNNTTGNGTNTNGNDTTGNGTNNANKRGNNTNGNNATNNSNASNTGDTVIEGTRR